MRQKNNRAAEDAKGKKKDLRKPPIFLLPFHAKHFRNIARSRDNLVFELLRVKKNIISKHKNKRVKFHQPFVRH